MLVPFGENSAACSANRGQQCRVRERITLTVDITWRGILENMLSVHRGLTATCTDFCFTDVIRCKGMSIGALTAEGCCGLFSPSEWLWGGKTPIVAGPVTTTGSNHQPNIDVSCLSVDDRVRTA